MAAVLTMQNGDAFVCANLEQALESLIPICDMDPDGVRRDLVISRDGPGRFRITDMTHGFEAVYRTAARLAPLSVVAPPAAPGAKRPRPEKRKAERTRPPVWERDGLAVSAEDDGPVSLAPDCPTVRKTGVSF